jgi:outer membrane protein OmpA-like peptidoglycan-associated protein
MKRDKQIILLGFPLLIVALLYLVSCATPPPTKELAAAESAYADAKAQCEVCKADWCKNVGKPDAEYCGYPCGDEDLAAAESALAKGRALASEFCSELEARRMLIDAKAKADEAKFKCTSVVPPPPPPPPAPELKDIFFDFDKYNIRPDAAAVLEEDAQYLRDNTNMTVMIEGYADIRGTPAYNLRLAQRRADSTKAYLVQLGIDPMRIQTSSGGETEKFGAGTTEEAYQLNRRAHFVVMEPQAKVGARIYFKYN